MGETVAASYGATLKMPVRRRAPWQDCGMPKNAPLGPRT
jgi:hypothetical protein